MNTSFEIKKSTQAEINSVLESHLNSLAFPMDSYLEDMLTASEIFSIAKKNIIIGCAAKQGDHLCFFH